MPVFMGFFVVTPCDHIRNEGKCRAVGVHITAPVEQDAVGHAGVMGHFFVRGDQHGLCLCGVEDSLIIEILNGVVPVQVLAGIAEHDQQRVLVRTGNIVHLLDIVPGCHNVFRTEACGKERPLLQDL